MGMCKMILEKLRGKTTKVQVFSFSFLKKKMCFCSHFQCQSGLNPECFIPDRSPSELHVRLDHVWRSESIQREMNAAQRHQLPSSINVNIDTLAEAGSAVIDDSLMSIYTQRSHCGITYSTVHSAAAQQRPGEDPGTATCVCGQNLRGQAESSGETHHTQEKKTNASWVASADDLEESDLNICALTSCS